MAPKKPKQSTKYDSSGRRYKYPKALTTPGAGRASAREAPARRRRKK